MRPYDVKKQMEKLLKSYEQYTRLPEEVIGGEEEKAGEFAGSTEGTAGTRAATQGASTTSTR
jgi:hypothetical protein